MRCRLGCHPHGYQYRCCGIDGIDITVLPLWNNPQSCQGWEKISHTPTASRQYQWLNNTWYLCALSSYWSITYHSSLVWLHSGCLCWEKLKTDEMDRHTHMQSFKVARTRVCHSFGRWLHRHSPVTYSNYLYRT